VLQLALLSSAVNINDLYRFLLTIVIAKFHYINSYIAIAFVVLLGCEWHAGCSQTLGSTLVIIIFSVSAVPVNKTIVINLANNFVRYKDSKIFYYIKNMNKTNSIPSVLQHNSISVETDKEKADTFNHYFYSTFTESAFDLLNINELPKQSSLIADISLSPTDIFKVLSTLQTTKASGADNIGLSVLKSCAAALTSPLHFLFSLLLKKQRGSFRMEVPYNHTSFQIR